MRVAATKAMSLAHPPHVPRARAAPGRRVGGLDVSAIALLAITVLLLSAAFLTFWPFITAIILGAWGAHLARPLFTRVDAALHGRQRSAALLTSGLVLLIAAPIALAVVTLVPAAKSLLAQLRSAGSGSGALAALVSNGESTSGGFGGIAQLLREHGADASKAVALALGASIDAFVGVFVFFVVFFAALVDAQRFSRWLDRNAPIDPRALSRMGDAFYQAGRGLLAGNGLTALVQGFAATIAYIALGVPRSLLLGFLTVIAALIPMIGTTIVWVPVAAGLLLTGHPVKAAILAALGVGVVGTIDNVIRPYLARRANVGLDTSILLVSMFGGIALLGGWGLLLGPLVVRLSVEALAIVRERRLVANRS